jgi:MtN3 and saliva related transmembrane protein
MPWIDWIGYLAASLTTLSFVPQALHLSHARRAGHFPGHVQRVHAGVALWLAYGLALRAWPIVGANAITLCLAAQSP